MVAGPDRPEANSGSGIDTANYPLPAGVDPSEHAVGARRHHGRPRRRQPRAHDQGRLHDRRQPGDAARQRLVERRRLRGRPARPHRRRGDDVHGHRLRRRERPDARARLRRPRRRARSPAPRLGDRPEDERARIGGDTLVVTGGATTTAAGGPTSPLVLYGDTSQDGAWYSSSTTHPVAPRFDDLLPLRPNCAPAATRSRSTRSALPTTSSTSRPRSRSRSSATT